MKEITLDEALFGKLSARTNVTWNQTVRFGAKELFIKDGNALHFFKMMVHDIPNEDGENERHELWTPFQCIIDFSILLRNSTTIDGFGEVVCYGSYADMVNKALPDDTLTVLNAFMFTSDDIKRVVESPTIDVVNEIVKKRIGGE